MCSGNSLINITVDILEQQLRNRNALCLVLDCRPFLAYNESHIVNSINIHCPPILRRRKNGHLPLRTIIPDVLTRERLSSKYFHTVILYDEPPLNYENNKSSDDSMIALVAKCLQQEAELKNLYVLDGGIQKFRLQYPQLCINNKEALRNCSLNKSPILGNLTWPLKSNGLTIPNHSNGIGLKICCNSVAASQNYLSGSSKYQILINNNSNNCARPNQLTTFNNNSMVISNKNFMNNNSSTSSPEDNNENILCTSNHNDYLTKGSYKVQSKSIDTVDCPSIITTIINHQSSYSSQQHHFTSQPPTSSSLLNNHHELNGQQCASNQQFNYNNNLNGLSGSCSQLNQLNICSTGNTNNLTHSMSLSNLTNLSSNKSNQQFNSQQCSYCQENENRSWIPKFNSFGNDALEPVEILPHLLLGSESHASQLDMLKRIGVTALLNVSHSCPNHFEKDFLYKCIPVQDSNVEDISVYFDDAIQFIDQVKANNGRVLVHCHAGISRSATICMAYIMSNMKLRMEEAYYFVKNRRSIVSPNFNFMGQLLSFESIVFAKPDDIQSTVDDSQMEIELPAIDKHPRESSIQASTKLNLKSINNELPTNAINDSNKMVNVTNSKAVNNGKLKNIFDFSTNCNIEPDMTINSKLDFSPIKKLNANISTHLLSPTT